MLVAEPFPFHPKTINAMPMTAMTSSTITCQTAHQRPGPIEIGKIFTFRLDGLGRFEAMHEGGDQRQLLHAGWHPLLIWGRGRPDLTAVEVATAMRWQSLPAPTKRSQGWPIVPWRRDFREFTLRGPRGGGDGKAGTEAGGVTIGHAPSGAATVRVAGATVTSGMTGASLGVAATARTAGTVTLRKAGIATLRRSAIAAWPSSWPRQSQRLLLDALGRRALAALGPSPRRPQTRLRHRLLPSGNTKELLKYGMIRRPLLHAQPCLTLVPGLGTRPEMQPGARGACPCPGAGGRGRFQPALPRLLRSGRFVRGPYTPHPEAVIWPRPAAAVLVRFHCCRRCCQQPRPRVSCPEGLRSRRSPAGGCRAAR